MIKHWYEIRCNWCGSSDYHPFGVDIEKVLKDGYFFPDGTKPKFTLSDDVHYCTDDCYKLAEGAKRI